MNRLSSTIRSDASDVRSELGRAQSALIELAAQKELAHTLWSNLKKEKTASDLGHAKELQVLGGHVIDAKQQLAATQHDLKEQQKQILLLSDAHAKECSDLEYSLEESAAREEKLSGQVRAMEAARIKEIESLTQKLKQAYAMQEESENRALTVLNAQDALSEKWRHENSNNILHFQRLLKESRSESARNAQRLITLESKLVVLEQQRAIAVAHAQDQSVLHDHVSNQLAATERKLAATIEQFQSFAAQVSSVCIMHASSNHLSATD